MRCAKVSEPLAYFDVSPHYRGIMMMRQTNLEPVRDVLDAPRSHVFRCIVISCKCPSVADCKQRSDKELVKFHTCVSVAPSSTEEQEDLTAGNDVVAKFKLSYYVVTCCIRGATCTCKVLNFFKLAKYDLNVPSQ
jgi:hypothetical protein